MTHTAWNTPNVQGLTVLRSSTFTTDQYDGCKPAPRFVIAHCLSEIAEEAKRKSWEKTYPFHAFDISKFLDPEIDIWPSLNSKKVVVLSHDKIQIATVAMARILCEPVREEWRRLDQRMLGHIY